VACFVIIGTLSKAIAAYLSGFLFRLPLSSAHMMFGLSSAHAAGAIAMVMVGMGLKGADGKPLVDEQMLNGVVIMILFTCIISSIVTDRSAQRIIVRDKEVAHDEEEPTTVERILVPVKYPEYANRLIRLSADDAVNPKRPQGIVALNVVYDDHNIRKNQEAGQRLLEQVSHYAAGSDVHLDTQVRIAANIANGIKHAFKEFQATEVLIGMHTHSNVSARSSGANSTKACSTA
jgi:phosphate/sulfate permease